MGAAGTPNRKAVALGSAGQQQVRRGVAWGPYELPIERACAALWLFDQIHHGDYAPDDARDDKLAMVANLQELPADMHGVRIALSYLAIAAMAEALRDIGDLAARRGSAAVAP